MDDVLERAERAIRADGVSWSYLDKELIRALAAEVRALRKDREMLDWLLDLSKRTDVGVVIETHGALVLYAGTRDEINDAMASRGEDA